LKKFLLATGSLIAVFGSGMVALFLKTGQIG